MSAIGAVLRIAAALAFVSAGGAQAPSSRAPLGDGNRIPVLLISGSDAFHDWRRTTPPLRSLLEESGRFDVRVCEDTRILESEAALSSYKVIFFNQQTPSSTILMRRNLRDYLQQGGGLVALHWAVDNFHDWPEFADLLGRVWQEGSSAEEHGTFAVSILDHQHPITRGLTDFQTSAGEAVHFRLRGEAAVHILATVKSQGGETVPVMFTHSPGKGRVFFTPFGHNDETRRNPNLQKIVLRATEWAATGEVREGSK